MSGKFRVDDMIIKNLGEGSLLRPIGTIRGPQGIIGTYWPIKCPGSFRWDHLEHWTDCMGAMGDTSCRKSGWPTVLSRSSRTHYIEF